jgi:CRP-like cAMP-binding protein
VINSDLGRARAPHHQLLNEHVARGNQRAPLLTVSAPVESIVGVEKRVLLALWQLAEYCGSVTAEGVTMPLRLTHELLALLVGSRRPSVTSALAALAEQGQIARRSDRSWLLTGECPAGIRLPAARA